MNKKTEIFEFQSEVKQLLHLMIHALYSNKEIFIRELISNASDAIDKVRFQCIAKPELYNNTDFRIKIDVNKNNKTLSISDNGIGMNRKEIIENLGTIAKSGTKSFLKSLKNKNKHQLIGQFGVGFYSSFIVADKVIVRTRSMEIDIDQGIQWESSGKGEYTIHEITKKERGTEIILFLKKEEQDFLEEWKIRNIVKKYSDHITVPVKILTYDEQKKTHLWQQINKANALWNANKKEISIQEYQDFYKYITNDSQDSLIWSHNHVEGAHEYTSLLYIPKKAAWDIWNRENKHGLKLYVKHVYIMDDAEQFLPNYLRFVRGIIDSNDLPLNISREILQDNRITYNLRQSLTKKVLQMLEKLEQTDTEKYQNFWDQFGLVIKEGLAEDSINNSRIASLLRFSSLYTNNPKQTLSLKEYVKKMDSNQEKIYFITSDSYASANSSPHLELFRKKEIDVLLLSDRIDEWMMNYLTEFQGKKLQSISKNDESLNKLMNERLPKDNKVEEKLALFIDKIKTLLQEKIKEVRLTYRLIDTPSIVLTDTNEMTTQMSKLFSSAGQKVPPIKYIFEINPKHKLIKKIINIKDEKNIQEWIYLLFEQALLTEQGNLENPNQFINRINTLLIDNII